MRRGFVSLLKPSAVETYDRLHADVWPEVLEGMRRAGVQSYVIYRQGTTLFHALRYDDSDLLWPELESDPDQGRWQALMSTLSDEFSDGRREHDLPCVFEFDPFVRSTSP